MKATVIWFFLGIAAVILVHAARQAETKENKQKFPWILNTETMCAAQVNQVKRADAELHRGDVQIGSIARLERQLALAIAFDPRSKCAADVHIERARVRQKMGKYQSALQDIREAQRLRVLTGKSREFVKALEGELTEVANVRR